MKDEHTYFKKMARNGRKNWYVESVLYQNSLYIQFKMRVIQILTSHFHLSLEEVDTVLNPASPGVTTTLWWDCIFFSFINAILNKTQPNFSRTVFFLNFWSTKICFEGQIFGNFLLFLVADSDYDQTQPKRLALKILVNTVTIFCSTSVKKINKYIST